MFVTTMAEHAIIHDKTYHEAVGALNWAAPITCPNIAFAVTTVTCFTTNLSISHWKAVKHIF
jgi:hypothetical protein